MRSPRPRLSCFHLRLRRFKHAIRIYRRDRGDDGCGPHRFATLAALTDCAEGSGAEYLYLFDGQGWQVASRGMQFFGGSDGSPLSVFRPLPEVLSRQDYMNARQRLHALVCGCDDWPLCGTVDLPAVQSRYVYESDCHPLPADFVDVNCGKPLQYCDCDDHRIDAGWSATLIR